MSRINEMNLSGTWFASFDDKNYFEAKVPGILGDPSVINSGRVFYKRTVSLPDWDFKFAVLTLKGARFCPRVYVNGVLISEKDGGMTHTTHIISRSDFATPGVDRPCAAEIKIELMPLDAVSIDDASRTPDADWWRTNVSSHLWDDCTINFYKDIYFPKIIPFTDFKNKTVTVKYELAAQAGGCMPSDITLRIMDGGKSIIQSTSPATNTGEIKIDASALDCWTIENPKCYRICISCGTDEYSFTYGLREFNIHGKQFIFNQKPVTYRGVSVVWHRFLRDPEGAELAFDEQWFLENIILRLKSHGGNGLRFHLGAPPERLLDLCDQYGLLVQIEWPFFHGVPASMDSLVSQWSRFLEMLTKHPCICIVHLWNETEGDEVLKALAAVDEISEKFPPMVISHRDVIHIHKYWWSMFENVGLYYDSFEQFEKAIVADEFGGNYLDGYCEPGKYPMLNEGFMRFLGRDYTKEASLELNTESNSRIAEYFRRIGAAGFTPFCALGSPEDGNHHFLGPLKFGLPKPVWGALTAAYAPVSISLDVWNRNYTPGQKIDVPLHIFNDTSEDKELEIELFVSGEYNKKVYGSKTTILVQADAYSTQQKTVAFTIPETDGRYRLNALLVTPQNGIMHEVLSSWRVFSVRKKIPANLANARVAVLHDADDEELPAFLINNNIKLVDIHGRPDIVLVSVSAFKQLASDISIKSVCELLLAQGVNFIFLDVGEMDLGQGYMEGNALGGFAVAPKIESESVTEYPLLCGLKAQFALVAEPESCLHPTKHSANLWANLSKDNTWLWSGLKGGLIVPATNMSVSALSQNAFLNVWKSRGADIEQIQTGDYYVYYLESHYAFSTNYNKAVEDELKRKIKLLVDDAPSLAKAINYNGKIQVVNLSRAYEDCRNGIIESIKELAVCGKGLIRTPLIEVTLENCGGRVVLSQLITKNRLDKTNQSAQLSCASFDPACEQFVLNMLSMYVE